MKISLLSAAVFLLAASIATTTVSGAASTSRSPSKRTAAFVVPQHPTSARRRVVPLHQHQRSAAASPLFLSSFPVDASTGLSVPQHDPRGEPPPRENNPNGSSTTSSSRYYGNQQQGIVRGQEQHFLEETSSSSLNPMVAMSVGTVMLLAGMVMTMANPNTPVSVHDDSTTTTTVLSEHDRRVQQDMFDYELQEQTITADVMSGGFYF